MRAFIGRAEVSLAQGRVLDDSNLLRVADFGKVTERSRLLANLAGGSADERSKRAAHMALITKAGLTSDVRQPVFGVPKQFDGPFRAFASQGILHPLAPEPLIGAREPGGMNPKPMCQEIGRQALLIVALQDFIDKG